MAERLKIGNRLSEIKLSHFRRLYSVFEWGVSGSRQENASKQQPGARFWCNSEPGFDGDAGL